MKTIQEVKMKFCIWKPHNGHETDNAKYYMPACVDIVHNLTHGKMFKFCPHCGGEINMEKVDIKMSKLLDKIYDYKCDYKKYCDNYEDIIEKCRKLYFENMAHFDKILDMGNSENVVFMYISWKLYNYYPYIIIENKEENK
jgi:hypothetical protein